MEFEKVVAGIVKYLNKNIFPGLNDWQTLLARTAVARGLRIMDRLKPHILQSCFLRTFASIDGDGNVDIDGWISELKKQIRGMPDQKVKVKTIVFGNYTFTESDIDELHKAIKEANR